MLDALRDRVSNGYAKRFRSGARHGQPSGRSTGGAFGCSSVALPLLRGVGQPNRKYLHLFHKPSALR